MKKKVLSIIFSKRFIWRQLKLKWKNIHELLINLTNSINSKEIPENENPKKIVNIV